MTKTDILITNRCSNCHGSGEDSDYYGTDVVCGLCGGAGTTSLPLHKLDREHQQQLYDVLWALLMEHTA